MVKPDRKIPGAPEWAGYEDDLDVRCAHKFFFGKPIAEVQRYFGGIHSIVRANELLFMPRRAFQYYVFAFAEYLLGPSAACDSDSASPFLRLLVAREERDRGSVAEIYSDLADVIEHVVSNQDYYEADRDIYGNFQDYQDRIRELCGVSSPANTSGNGVSSSSGAPQFNTESEG